MDHARYDRRKRILDVVGVLVLLGLSAPLFALIALLIKVTSGGSVFFRQRRLGKDGKCFRMWKFRTMVDNAEHLRAQVGNGRPAAEGPQELSAQCKDSRPVAGYFKVKRDPRITPIGRVLRRLSLDELPQLFNVIQGDMSLLGPRPLVWDDVNLDDCRMRERCQVLPGLTGLWQIKGRNEIMGEQALDLDLEYVRERSSDLDLKILLRTPLVILTGRGAY